MEKIIGENKSMAEEEAPKLRSVVLVEFEGINSVAIKKLYVEGVAPMQILALAQYLEVSAKAQIMDQLQMEAEKARVAEVDRKIIRPN